MATFIKHKDQDPVNLDFVSSVKCRKIESTSKSIIADQLKPIFIIGFEDTGFTWDFKTEEEQKEVFENILEHMNEV